MWVLQTRRVVPRWNSQEGMKFLNGRFSFSFLLSISSIVQASGDVVSVQQWAMKTPCTLIHVMALKWSSSMVEGFEDFLIGLVVK